MANDMRMSDWSSYVCSSELVKPIKNAVKLTCQDVGRVPFLCMYFFMCDNGSLFFGRMKHWVDVNVPEEGERVDFIFYDAQILLIGILFHRREVNPCQGNTLQ